MSVMLLHELVDELSGELEKIILVPRVLLTTIISYNLCLRLFSETLLRFYIT